MRFIGKLTALCLAVVLAAMCLAACSGGANSAQNGSAGSETAAAENSATREDVEAALQPALEREYSSLGFSEKTETTATATVNGQTQQQTMETTMVGEINKAADDKRVHMACTSRSNTALGVTSYDMFIDKDYLFVTQGDQLYRDELGAEAVDNYALSVTAITSKDQIDMLLDVASGCKVEQQDDETVVTITADPRQLAESGLFDESSLPEGSSVATLVANYTIGSDNRFKTARLMSSTSGTPTYRVSQTYRYYDYDNVKMPEWPDWQGYIAKQSGILTDENGRMYLVGEDGQVYYIESIGADGTINFDMSMLPTTAEPQYDTTYVETGTGGGSTSDGTTTTTVTSGDTSASSASDNANASGTSSSDKGRAYITAYDGTIHYLDEPGSRIMDLGGTLVFIDADGEWYFLNVDDNEDLSEYMNTSK